MVLVLEGELYLSEVATELNVVVKLVPTVVTAVTMTTAISEAIKAYSIAVAPPSFAKKRAIDFIDEIPARAHKTGGIIAGEPVTAGKQITRNFRYIVSRRRQPGAVVYPR
jgi:hypothetical protein